MIITRNIVKIYQDLTGKTVPESQKKQYEAWGKRAIRELSNKLGWSIEDLPDVNVIGKSKCGCECIHSCDYDCDCHKKIQPIGDFKVFNYESKKPFAHIDPYTKVHNVYICRIISDHISSDNIDVIILKKITNYSQRFFSNNMGKYIQGCEEMNECAETCRHECKDCTALLIDANWAVEEEFPEDLLYLICDYIDWMANGGPSSRNITSESVDGHSVSYNTDKNQSASPFEESQNIAVLERFVGPNGSIGRKLIY